MEQERHYCKSSEGNPSRQQMRAVHKCSNYPFEIVQLLSDTISHLELHVLDSHSPLRDDSSRCF